MLFLNWLTENLIHPGTALALKEFTTKSRDYGPWARSLEWQVTPQKKTQMGGTMWVGLPEGSEPSANSRVDTSQTK